MFIQTKAKPDFMLAKVQDLTLTSVSKKRQAEEELGVELEIEGTKLSTAYQKLLDTGCDYWNQGTDGSLQDGYEYTFKQPFNRAIAKKALEAFFKVFKEHAQISNSSRCSTHIHLNFQHMSMMQVYTFKTLFSIFEWPLFEKFAPERLHNNYCTPTFRVAKYAKATGESLKQGKFNPTQKYRALNDSPLSSYGSLECRMLGGSDNAEKPLEWIAILLELYDYVRDNPRLTPADILDRDDFTDFVKTAFPKIWAALSTLQNIDKMLTFGLNAVQDYAYAVDWTEMKTAEPPKNVRKVNPELAPPLEISDDDDDFYDGDDD